MRCRRTGTGLVRQCAPRRVADHRQRVGMVAPDRTLADRKTAGRETEPANQTIQNNCNHSITLEY